MAEATRADGSPVLDRSAVLLDGKVAIVTGGGDERAQVEAMTGAALDAFGQVAGAARGLEDHAEVQGLAAVDDVEDLVGLQGVDAVADRGQVAGGVAEAAVALADDQRDRLAVESQRAAARGRLAASNRRKDHPGHTRRELAGRRTTR